MSMFDFEMESYTQIESRTSGGVRGDGTSGDLTTYSNNEVVGGTIELTRWENGDIEKNYYQNGKWKRYENYSKKTGYVSVSNTSDYSNIGLFQVYTLEGKLVKLSMYDTSGNRDDKVSSKLHCSIKAIQFGDAVKQALGIDSRTVESRTSDQLKKIKSKFSHQGIHLN